VTVRVSCEHPRGRAAAARLKRRAGAFLRALGRDGGELSILLVGDRGIRRLNRSWRGEDVATDVLSFPAAAPAGELLGDVVISLDTAVRVARAERRALGDELDRYLVHGLLHLLGFDHEEPVGARRMARAEDELLGADGLVAAVGRAEAAPAAPPPRAAARPRSRPPRATAPAPTRRRGRA
jgi:probable rRNA maturation factor